VHKYGAYMCLRSLHGVAATVLLIAFAGPAPALADTIEAALVRAYQGNPQLAPWRTFKRWFELKP
jgi:outer membrane protein